jgi:hypothetical protein
MEFHCVSRASGSTEICGGLQEFHCRAQPRDEPPPVAKVPSTIVIVNQKDGIHADGNGATASCDRSDEVDFFLTTRGTADCLVVAGHQRSGKLTLHDTMVARLGQMHIGEQILLVDGDRRSPFFNSGSSLTFRTPAE